MVMLENWLKEHGIAYVRTREPGGTSFGIEIRELLLSAGNPGLKIDALAEALLFQADRALHFAEVVLPALEEGKLVITDRCFDASIAYQGYARGVGVELVARLSVIATQGHVPNLTILLDLDPSQVHTRTDTSNDQGSLREEQTRFDKEAEEFHRKVREAFLTLARF